MNPLSPQDFLELVLKLCKDSGYSIEHEDPNGGFVIAPWSQGSADWLREANIKEEE